MATGISQYHSKAQLEEPVFQSPVLPEMISYEEIKTCW
jgi:hypothetical protein